MTQITEPSREAAPALQESGHASDILMNLVIALLAPMFLGVTAGDITLARLAAAQTVNAYQTRSHADLIAVAQIIACGLAALGSLSLSMDDDISIPMALRLRGNAIALNRSAEQHRRAIRGRRQAPAMPPIQAAPTTPNAVFEPADAEYEAAVVASVAEARRLAQARLQETKPTPVVAPIPAATPTATAASVIATRQKDQMRGAAMADAAEECAAGLAHLPPHQRALTSHRTAALSTTANHLIAGTPLPGFPTHPG